LSPIASVRAHGVRTLLVYCRGRREGDWPRHHAGALSIDGFGADRHRAPLHCLRMEAGSSAAGLQRAAGDASHLVGNSKNAGLHCRVTSIQKKTSSVRRLGRYSEHSTGCVRGKSQKPSSRSRTRKRLRQLALLMVRFERVRTVYFRSPCTCFSRSSSGSTSPSVHRCARVSIASS
jgi:hypothetical protein